MREEIAAAVVFLSRVLREDNDKDTIKNHMDKFSDSLTTQLRERFKNHWYEDNPHKGQAYRCIRVNRVSPDPVLQKALEDSGLDLEELHLPKELTLWVDPSEVTCRIGEQIGSTFHTVAAFKNGHTTNQAHTVNIAQLLEMHNHKRDQALFNMRQFSCSRVNAGSPKNDAGVNSEGVSSPFSPAKYRAPPHHGHHPQYAPHHRGHGGPPMGPPPLMGARHHKFHHRASPPFDMPPPPHLRASPPFLPNFHAPMNGAHHGDNRHWMRGPDLVKA